MDTGVGAKVVREVQTDQLDVAGLLEAQERLVKQEGALQEELGLMRTSLSKQSAESQQLLASWMQAQDALKQSGEALSKVSQVGGAWACATPTVSTCVKSCMWEIVQERQELTAHVSKLSEELESTKAQVDPMHTRLAAQDEHLQCLRYAISDSHVTLVAQRLDMCAGWRRLQELEERCRLAGSQMAIWKLKDAERRLTVRPDLAPCR
jgi:chromosome segregation ATPase